MDHEDLQLFSYSMSSSVNSLLNPDSPSKLNVNSCSRDEEVIRKLNTIKKNQTTKIAKQNDSSLSIHFSDDSDQEDEKPPTPPADLLEQQKQIAADRAK